jgi:hypothetical protein
MQAKKEDGDRDRLIEFLKLTEGVEYRTVSKPLRDRERISSSFSQPWRTITLLCTNHSPKSTHCNLLTKASRRAPPAFQSLFGSKAPPGP